MVSSKTEEIFIASHNTVFFFVLITVQASDGTEGEQNKCVALCSVLSKPHFSVLTTDI